MTFTVDTEQRQTMIRQMGRMNFLAACGGRVFSLPDGIDMPTGEGYRIWVRYTPSDDYTVERVFVRGGKVFHKGKATMVYAPELGEVVYNASCYAMKDEDYWPYDLDKGLVSEVNSSS